MDSNKENKIMTTNTTIEKKMFLDIEAIDLYVSNLLMLCQQFR